MEIGLANREKIIFEIENWFKPKPVIEELPTNIYSAMHDGVLVAVGALRHCEGPVCMIDTLATNPKCESPLRHEAIEKLVSAITASAKGFGYKGIMGNSKEPSIITRAIREGYEVFPQITFARSLT